MLAEKIRSKRLLLRRCRDSDLEAYCRLVYRNPEVMRTLPGGEVLEPDYALQRARDNLIVSWAKDTIGPWLAEDLQNGDLLGHCGLRYWPDTTDVEVLYAFHPRYWGQGLAAEAAAASISAGFRDLDIPRIIAGVFTGNHRSIRVLEKLGMQHSHEQVFAGKTVHMYELKRADWPACLDPGVEISVL